jgi:ribosomal protein L4
MRMAGRMGNVRQTTQNLTVHAVDAERGLILIRAPFRARGVPSCSSRPRRRGPDTMANLTVDVLDASGESAGTALLPEEIFGVQTNIPLIHQVVVAQLAAARQGTHSTKTVARCAAAARSPTSRRAPAAPARARPARPQFAGGGVVHGPMPRDYSRATPKKMKAAALRGALSDRARHGRPCPSSRRSPPATAPSTKTAVALLQGRQRAPATCSVVAERHRPAVVEVAGQRRPGCTLLAPASSTPTTSW